MVHKPKTQLDRATWVRVATLVLAEQGIDGVRVEVLAKRCEVTKGSFYWHFKNRHDLLQAMLETWKEGRIKDILKQTRVEPGRELHQLRHVLDVYSANRNRRGMQIELAVRDWARRDADAAAIVLEVDAIRLDCARRLFLASGASEGEASIRSVLLYAYVFGQSLMTVDSLDRDLGDTKERIAQIITQASAS